MSQISVTKAEKKTLDELGTLSWPIWEKETSVFDWEYDEKETCYILQGRVIVTTENGKDVHFGKGDLVVFPKGLKCKWQILEDVRKHYKFG